MKNIRIVTDHINVDLASSSRTRQENIMRMCKTLVKRGGHFNVETLGAEVLVSKEDVLISIGNVQYVCNLREEGLYLTDDAKNLVQRIDDSEAYYELVKTIEEVVLRASLADPN